MNWGSPVFVIIIIVLLSKFLLKLIYGPEYGRSKDKKKHGKDRDTYSSSADQQMLEEVYHGLADLGKRIENLEIILDDKDRGNNYG